ncbi:MAG: replicative DNA helicase [Bacteroidetes bacterium RIFCSPLOWO2_02_FULL_36_8]|nr:MAG: replicative DNA helicase [Bacteroidetes bacterium RIFCSPLOWO2_02_FULL_36_8]OFY69436.1 MAG: replicative DNA helicase [Bacteroidetes bacterium RIFCSPLOWO2_12_FULL_37_12]
MSLKLNKKQSPGIIHLPKDLEMMSLGKLPPQAIELEEAVLGAMLLEKEPLQMVIDLLKPEMFYKEAHQKIYKAMLELFNDTQPIDLLTVTTKLRMMGELEQAGGAFAVAELSNRVASSANIEAHARIIIEKYLLRQLISISGNIHGKAFDDTTDVFDLLDETAKNLFEVTDSTIRKNYEDLPNLLNQAIEEIDKKRLNESELTGVGSGFTDLDRITGGWQKSELILVAARPSMGKTAFIMTAARNAAIIFEKPVAVFSLEMSSIQLVNRLISAEAELASDKLRHGKLANHEWEQLQHKIDKLSRAKIFIDDTPALSILEFRAKCRRLKSQHKVELIIIDYLQLMTPAVRDNRNFSNREQEIASISRALKAIAKELNVPVVALSQLSRALESRKSEDKKPILSDLRESGSLEQDADVVIFLYRPEVYKLDVDNEGNSLKNICEVIVAKHRNGAIGEIRLRFISKFTRFEDLSLSSSDTIFETTAESQNTITRSSKLNDSGQDEENPTPF